MAMKRFTSWLVIGLMAVALTGCGAPEPETQPVTGTVTLDGEPLANARVKFDKIAEGAMKTPWIPRNPRPIPSPAEVKEILALAAG